MINQKESLRSRLGSWAPFQNWGAWRRYRYVALAAALLLSILSFLFVFRDLLLDYSWGRYSDTAPAWSTLGQQESGGNRFSELLPVPSRDHLLSPKIWQIQLPKGKGIGDFVVDDKNLEYTTSWIAKNPSYTYTLVGPKGANGFVNSHYADNPELRRTYHNLPNVGMKSDMLRYLILSNEGGVYSDTDTVALRPIDEWVPKRLRSRVRLVVGIEFDRLDGPQWSDINHDVQFCQWTIAAAAGHPVFTKMAARIVASLQDQSAAHGVPMDQLRPSSFDVMNSTGPAAWTDVVFAQLQEFDPSLKTTADLSGLTAPRLIGDVLVLPVDGFGMGQQHSHSTHDGSTPAAALVKHIFAGTWREGTSKRSISARDARWTRHR